MVTGCGFPDVATRHFVTKLCQLVPNLVPVGLCDYNPYGLALMLTYDSSHCRSAALSKCFKGFREIKDLGVQLRWLGLRSPHIAFLTNKLHKSVFQPFTKHDAGQLRRLERLGRVLDSSALEEEVEAMKKGRYMNTIDTIHKTISQRIHSFYQQLAHPCSACPDLSCEEEASSASCKLSMVWTEESRALQNGSDTHYERKITSRHSATVLATTVPMSC